MNLSKSLNLIGCHGNIKGKFSKNYSKIFSSEAIRVMKLKLSIHVHDISLYINCVYVSVFFFYCRCSCGFVAGKSGNCHLFLCYCRYRTAPGVVPYQPYDFVKITDFDWLQWQPKG